MRLNSRIFSFALGFLWLAGQGIALASEVVLTSSADTSLIEAFPDNNIGSVAFLLVGTSENLTKHRALMKFDLNNIPSGSKIKSATLLLEVTQVPGNGYAASNFELRRMLRDWGEGTKGSPTNCNSCTGQGIAATIGEATWNSGLALTTNGWGEAGAMEAVDYAADISFQQFIYTVGLSPYIFESSEIAVADIQNWLAHPETNFGWLIKTSSEDTVFTARRLGSRERAGNEPLLQIEFIPPPQLGTVSIVGNQFSFLFTAEAGQPYVVERKFSLAATNNWAVFTNIAAQADTGDVTVSDTLGSQSYFYRVIAP